MTTDPRTAIGIPVYNHAHQLERTLDSILSQSDADLAVVAVDDCSTDDSPQILERFARADPRLRVFRNEERMGYTRNARRAFELCRELFPSIEFFAWGSDHDLWHPHWLRVHTAALKAQPEASMAWCWCLRITGEGDIVRSREDTLARGMSEDRLERIRFSASEAPAGFFLHGLIRVSALARTSGLRLVLVPDRLLVAELAAAGPFVLVPEFLWYRRYFGLATRDRQRRSSFTGRAPLYTYLPIGVQHGLVLFHDFVLRRRGMPQFGALDGLRLTLAYVRERRALLQQREDRRSEVKAHKQEKRDKRERLRRKKEAKAAAAAGKPPLGKVVRRFWKRIRRAAERRLHRLSNAQG